MACACWAIEVAVQGYQGGPVRHQVRMAVLHGPNKLLRPPDSCSGLR